MKINRISKAWLALVCLLFLLPTIVTAQNDHRDFNGYRWYDDGIHFMYPLSIAGDAVATIVPAAAGSPETVQVIFQDYHDDTGWLPTGAEIDIMPISTLPNTLSSFVEALDNPQDALPLPALYRLLDQPGDEAAMLAQFQNLDFQSGSGARFVFTRMDSLDAVGLSYRYLGKTTDGLYLIRAAFPFHAIQFHGSQSLDTLAGSDFTPDLETLDSLVASLSISAPEAVLLTTETGGQVDYQGIRFAHDPSLAYRVEVDAVSPVGAAEAQGSMYGEMPGYTRFTLVGYPAVGSVQQPQVFVMPVSEFPGVDQPYGAQFQHLQSLLTAHPALNPAADPGSQDYEPLPIFPLFNAAQTLISQPQYRRFASGEGLRYITYYAQSAEPLASNDLFYAYTGLSDDGRYVVAAIFPLEASFLPQGRTVYDIADYERFMMNYQTYLDGLLLQIDVMNQSAYVPQIDLLDAIIASMSVIPS